jgi:hypothetical protein
MILNRLAVDYALVGERDGFAGRPADASLWRREAYRRGYAQGLLARAERIAQGSLPMPVVERPVAEARP